MPATVDFEVQGLIEAQKEMERLITELHGEPVLRAFQDATLMVTRDAKLNAPVDTGRLRASITPEVTLEGQDVLGIVGSNVVYAPQMELGADPHWPNMANLTVWASRHNLDAYVVAQQISRRGLAPRRFLEDALIGNMARIQARIEQGVDEATR